MTNCLLKTNDGICMAANQTCKEVPPSLCDCMKSAFIIGLNMPISYVGKEDDDYE